ncbi:MAG: cupin domain-containing protein [Pseudomonadota bacterium]
MTESIARKRVLHIPAGAGRAYQMGGISSFFLADGAETDDSYSISEWWLEAGERGPGAHQHEANDDIFYVIEGVMTFLAGEEKFDAAKGAFLRVPAGVLHDFENNSAARAGVLNISFPGGFEQDMPAIVDWFKVNRPVAG